MEHTESIMDVLNDLERIEKEKCQLAQIFAEMFKDEINAIEEIDLYEGVKKIVRKYHGDRNAMALINEFTSAISGGASLVEILAIARDEAVNPTLASELTTDDRCDVQ